MNSWQSPALFLRPKNLMVVFTKTFQCSWMNHLSNRMLAKVTLSVQNKKNNGIPSIVSY